ncbi:hypothetical protein [Herbaspirillum chlorophenolicum]|uniref:hypothetical protein n=1 Tax=Herbaspirillum chlorophenolicum TaxID=211589 RepID=UPI000B01B984|nr:hypothetical protein [Herbaspirillum chlorophenolicum]
MTFNERVTNLLQMPLSPITWDSILRECDRLDQDFPHIHSAYKWTLDYRRFQVEHERGNNGAAIWHLKSAIATMPYNSEIVEDYRQLVKKEAGIHSLVLIITSKINEAKAFRLAAQFDQADIDYMIVSGADTPSIAHARALQVDVSDRYESNPQKVAAAFTWVYENIGANVGVLKVDDDMVLQDGAKLRASLERLAHEGGYAGVPSGGSEHDRCWHWGLCLSQDLNKRVYGRPVLRPWAAGGAYYLGARALEKLILSLMRFPGLFEGEYYEDKLIGDVLVFEGEQLNDVGGYAAFGLSEATAASAPGVQAPMAAAPVAPVVTIAPPAAASVPPPAPAAPASVSQKGGAALRLSEWNSR